MVQVNRRGNQLNPVGSRGLKHKMRMASDNLYRQVISASDGTTYESLKLILASDPSVTITFDDGAKTATIHANIYEILKTTLVAGSHIGLTFNDVAKTATIDYIP